MISAIGRRPARKRRGGGAMSAMDRLLRGGGSALACAGFRHALRKGLAFCLARALSIIACLLNARPHRAAHVLVDVDRPRADADRDLTGTKEADSRAVPVHIVATERPALHRGDCSFDDPQQHGAADLPGP